VYRIVRKRRMGQQCVLYTNQGSLVLVCPFCYFPKQGQLAILLSCLQILHGFCSVLVFPLLDMGMIRTLTLSSTPSFSSCIQYFWLFTINLGQPLRIFWW
jgi:hypothetical protein